MTSPIVRSVRLSRNAGEVVMFPDNGNYRIEVFDADGHMKYFQTAIGQREANTRYDMIVNREESRIQRGFI